MALQEHLVIDFPRIPKPHIRSRLHDYRFYAPTHLLLTRELEQESLPFRLKSTSTVVSKGKARQDPEFDKEREWVLLGVANSDSEQDAALAASINEQEYEDTGESIECGCCFSGYPFVRIRFLLCMGHVQLFNTGPDNSMPRSTSFL